ncbi:MAG: ribosome maturation factor RimP [Lachnospiraceae bacterium]|nr:ribosome maturation factor RimP [Lachnospiraceae bacterium]
MSKKEDIEKRTEELLTPILDDAGFDLWDVGYVREGQEMYLRVFIDKPGGIMIDDCVDVSRKLSDKLDEDDFIEDAYTLEVSSPGLGRKLVKDREFTRSIGRDVDIKFYRPVDGSKETSGKLVAFDKESVTIEDTGGKAPPSQRSYARSDIATVKLSVDF